MSYPWLFAACIVLYWPTVESLRIVWGDTAGASYTHGYLVAIVAAWMLWHRREALGRQPLRPAYWASGLVVLCALAWLVAYRAGLQLAHQVLLPIIMGLAVFTACGARVARICAMPLAYLYCAIPVWDPLNGTLQTATVVASRVVLTTIGIPAYFVGNFVHIPAGVFEIAGGCSGLNYLIVAVAIAALYGEVREDSVRHRLWLVALGAGLAIVGNWIRVLVVILAGHLTGMQHYLVRVEHGTFGWAVFALMMAAFFVVARWLPATAPAAQDPERGTASSGPGLMPRGLLLALAALAVAPVWAGMTQPDATALPNSVLKPATGSWRGPLAATGDWLPVFPGADHQVLGAYSSARGTVEVLLAEYATQHQGKEMVGFDNNLPGHSFMIESMAPARSADGVSFNALTIADSRESQAVLWYRYQVGNRFFTSGLLAQLGYGIASLEEPPPSRIIAARAPCRPDCDSARNLLAEFLSEVGVPTPE